MARTLAATLLAAQKGLTGSPIWKLTLSHGVTTYTYTSADRLFSLKHWERPYSQRAEIILDNSDSTLTALSLEGYKAMLSYGYTTTSGDEYSDSAPMYVQEMNLISPRLFCGLTLIGLPDLLDEDHASHEYTQASDDTQTVKDLFTAICDTTLTDGTNTPYSQCTAYTPVFDSEDALIDAFAPAESFSIAYNESRLSALKRLISYTGCVFRVENDGSNSPEIHVFAPTTTGTSYDYEYSLTSGEHTFIIKGIRHKIVFPNKVTVSSYPDSGDSYTGNATDASYSIIPKEKFYYLPVDDNDEAGDIATALLLHGQLGAESGAGTVPINVGAEAYDYVKITDSVESDSVVGNQMYIYRHCGAAKGSFTGFEMITSFGEPELGSGFASAMAGSTSASPDYTSLMAQLSSLRYDVDTIAGYLGNIENGVNNTTSLLAPHSLPTNVLRNAQQPYIVDMTWSSTAYNSVTFTSGTITFSDGSTQAVASTGSPKTLTATHHAYIVLGSSTVQWSTTFSDTIGANKVWLATCVCGAATDSKALVIPVANKSLVINTSLLYADMIIAEYIAAGAIEAEHLEASLVLATEIICGSGVKDSTLSGFSFKSDEIVGQLSGVDQCVLNTSGKILAGTGAVILDANGIVIKDSSDTNKWIDFQNSSGNNRGYIYLNSSDNLQVSATNDVSIGASDDVTISATDDISINAGGDLLLYSLPAADPSVSGAVWNDGGTLKISAG